MKRVLFFLFGCVFALVACKKKDSINNIEDISLSKLYLTGVIKVGVDMPYKPMSFLQDGLFAGFDIDVINEACTCLDLTPEYIAIDWSEKDKLLESGEIDMIASGFSKTAERELYYGMSVPLLTNVLCIIVRDNETRFTDFESLKDYRVGYMADSTAADYIAAHTSEDFSVKPMEYKTLNEALQNVSRSLVDAVIGDMVMVSYLINNEGQTGFKILPEALDLEYYVYAFRREDKALIAEFNDVLQQLASDDILGQITKKWFKNDISLLR